MPRCDLLLFAVIIAGLGLTGLGSSAMAADPAAGKAVFSSQCSICHSPQPGTNRVGPSLFGVFGRKAGSVPGYSYSPAMKDSNIVWDEANLSKYLESPRTVVPGTKMPYAGLKDDTRRANLIAYLATLK